METHMKKMSYHSRRGALAFEWIIICTLLVIGMIGALGALRTSLYKTAEVLPAGVSSICDDLAP